MSSNQPLGGQFDPKPLNLLLQTLNDPHGRFLNVPSQTMQKQEH